MKSQLHISAAFILASVLISCNGDETLRPDPNGPQSNLELNSFTGQFKAIWNGINEGYTYWPLTDIDWDRRYKEFLPVFEQLDSDYEEWKENGTAADCDFITPDSLISLYKSLTYGLIDGHMTVKFIILNDPQYTISISPARQIWKERNGTPNVIGRDDFRPYTALRKNTGIATRIAVSGDEGDYSSYNVCYAVGGRYLYYRYPGFEYDDFEESESEQVQQQSDYHKCLKHFRELLAEGQKNKWLKGVIIDLRRNGGGACAAFPYSPVGMLLDRSMLTIGTYQGKNGLGHYDLTPRIPFIVTGSGDTEYPGPVVLLTDSNTGSMAEIAVLTAQSKPNWTVIGTTTAGAIGGWFGNSYFTYMNGEVGNGYSQNAFVRYGANYAIRMSHMILRGLDGTCSEGIGIDPDIAFEFDNEKNKATFGRQDSQFEAAVSYLDGTLSVR